MATNGTAPDRMVGWISPVPQRSTWDIIWSCLSIFLLCSWRAVHLNLPTPDESLGEWYEFPLGKLMLPYWPKKPLRTKWRRKIFWMVVICLAPEVGVGMAVSQYFKARQTLKVTSNNTRNGQEFTMAHAFYANMGGIVVRRVTLPTAQPGSNPEEEKSQPLDANREWTDTVSPLQELGNSDLWNSLDDADIKDKSHADVITKLLAIVQSSWLVVNSIARAARGLSISQLELATMAFIVCALVMYTFWWHKPFNVERRHTLVALTQAGISNINSRQVCPFHGRVPDMGSDDFAHLIWDGLENNDMSPLAIYVTGSLFSAVHLLAWNWKFPSLLIQTLWRCFATTALVTSLAPLYAIAVEALGEFLSEKTGKNWVDDYAEWLSVFILLAIGVMYIISRLAILALTFYCFVAVPASTYEVVMWTAFIPHFGS